MGWSEKDLQKLIAKGLKVTDKKPTVKENMTVPKIKIVKVSVEKRSIQLVLESLKNENKIDDFVTELKFDENRRFRFDWAIPSKMIAIEYEGIYSKKSRHTTIEGYNRDTKKYNLAALNGWRVLRYTAENYKNLESDLIKML